MLVLLHVEAIIVVPALFNSELETLYTMLQRAVIIAFAFAGIAIVAEETRIRSEFFYAILCRFLLNYHHERSDEESRVCQVDSVLSSLSTMINFRVALVLLRREQFLELAAVPVHVCKVQRSEISVEGMVAQLVVNVKEKGIRNILRRFLISYPVQFICRENSKYTVNLL